MNLQTYVHIPKPNFDISHQSKMLLLGSCFSENIGAKLVEHKFAVNVNPFGIMYNPLSIYNGIKRLLDEVPFSEKDFIFHNGMYHSFMHHGSFSRINLKEAVENVNHNFNSASDYLKNADFLLITFGTSYVFRWKESGEIVGNCHKIPADKFSRERLTVDDIVLQWSSLIQRILLANRNLKILFTVSPIRHFKDGAHENQLSKAILHLSVDKIKDEFSDNLFYFPAYEIVMDQLRDYRFYTDDMLHPSLLTQNYIWKRFGDTYFSVETEKINAEWRKIVQALSHKPYHSRSEEYQKFIHRTIDELQAFEERYPFLSCFQEKQELTQLLNHSY
ncbi:MAG: GSCFA domain-containing protein [Dysgonamonadaceae bacterium]|nr:GSCFA domain-containing protein [Dysgonamonadaceae bacterium]MDD4247384.1 GSCFA domain-containing protein [Dysgonamonadaceae bacterium]